MGEIISFLPIGYQMRIRGTFIPQEIVFINWLKFEAMPRAALMAHPVLHEIRGWRNRECYEYVTSYDWTAKIYE